MLYGIVCLFLFQILLNVSALKIEKLIGGYPAYQEDFKYQAVIYGKDNSSEIGRVICMGGIIDEDLILTTAECLFDGNNLKEYSFFVAVGFINLNTTSNLQIAVDIIFLCDDGSPIFENNIVILKLKKKLYPDFKELILKLNIPLHKEIFRGFFYKVAGYIDEWIDVEENNWSRIRATNGSSPYPFRYAYVQILKNELCSLNHPGYDINKILCGQLVTPSESQNWSLGTKDLGSPLVIDNKVIGIANPKFSNYNNSVYGSLYLKVSSYTNFIYMIQGGIEHIIEDLPPTRAVIRRNRPHILTLISK